MKCLKASLRFAHQIALVFCVPVAVGTGAFGAQELPLVAKLVATVTEHAQKLEAIGPDRIKIFVAVTERNTDIHEAAEAVMRRKQHSAAIVALANLVKATKSSSQRRDQLLCANAAFALGALGVADKQAIAVLNLLKDHELTFVRNEASDALKKIQKHEP